MSRAVPATPACISPVSATPLRSPISPSPCSTVSAKPPPRGRSMSPRDVTPPKNCRTKMGAFDLVTCRVAAHHFSDVAAFVRETARVLKTGGWFLLIDGSIEDSQPVAEKMDSRR